MDRRTFLVGVGSVTAAVAVTGCTTTPATEPPHEVTVRNMTTDSRSLGVLISGESGTLFDHRYELSAASETDDHGFTGKPTTITAVVDGDREIEFEYDPVRCYDRKLVGVVLSITGPRTVRLSYTCTTIEEPQTTNGEATRP